MRASAVVKWLAWHVWGIDTDHLLAYLSDPSKYHGEAVDTEDVMP